MEILKQAIGERVCRRPGGHPSAAGAPTAPGEEAGIPSSALGGDAGVCQHISPQNAASGAGSQPQRPRCSVQERGEDAFC